MEWFAFRKTLDVYVSRLVCGPPEGPDDFRHRVLETGVDVTS